MTIDNLTLYLAQEQNDVIIQSLKNKYENNELKYQIPYTTTFSQAITTGDNHSVQIRLNRLLGSKLQRIYWVPYRNNGVNNQRYDSNNLGSDKIASFYTTLNNRRNQQFNFVTTDGNEWLTVKDRLKQSCIVASNDWSYNYCHMHLFGGELSSDLSYNLDQGLPLEEETIFAIQATAGTVKDLKHMIFAVTQREMGVTPQGIVIV
eukprot:Lithocolla_globosa_v1_NODE_2509_length_1968_cov_596.127026.p1 type:complete len:205 gc:universal NODE_2509_length_1968_cov_596.127026:734-1348(+)